MRNLLSFIMLFSAFAGWAQVPEYRFSLREAQEFAVENGYDAELARAEIEKSKKLILETASPGLPQLIASGNFQKFLELPTSLLPGEVVGGQPGTFVPIQFGTEYNATGSLQLNQMIFDGSYFVALVATKVVKQNALQGYERTAVQTKELVATTYNAVLINERLVDVLDENITLLQKNFDENRLLYAEGFIEPEDVDQLELLISELQTNKDYTARVAEVTRYLLNIQLGLPVETNVTLTDEIENLVSQTVSGESILNTSFDYTQSVEYRNLENRERGASLSLKNEQMAYVPKIDLFLTISSNYQSNDAEFWNSTNSDFWFPTQVIGAGISVPIITGMRRVARVQQARIDLDRVSIAKNQLIGNLKAEYLQSKAAYEFSLSNLNIRKRNMEIAQNILNKNLIKYREGIISSLELTQTQNQYIEALRTYVNAAQSTLDAKASLERILGIYNFE